MKHAFSPDFSISNCLDMVQQLVGLLLSVSLVDVFLFYLMIVYLHFNPPAVITELNKTAAGRP